MVADLAVRDSRAWAGRAAVHARAVGGGAGFLAVWMPYNNGLRVEPLIALGALFTWVCVERSIATGRFLPLTIGIMAAALTLTAHPTGVMARGRVARRAASAAAPVHGPAPSRRHPADTDADPGFRGWRSCT